MSVGAEVGLRTSAGRPCPFYPMQDESLPSSFCVGMLCLSLPMNVKLLGSVWFQEAWTAGTVSFWPDPSVAAANVLPHITLGWQLVNQWDACFLIN